MPAHYYHPLTLFQGLVATPSSVIKVPENDTTPYCLQVPILIYHHIEPMQEAIKEKHQQFAIDAAVFDMQMKYLAEEGYTTIFLSDLVDALMNQTSLPERSIAVTVDDGYKDNYEYALPILEKYNLKANYMIPTGLIMNPGYMSWSDLRDIVQRGNIALYNHTWSHAALDLLPMDKVQYELRVSQQQFKEKLGFQPDIFTYPYGSYNVQAIEALKENGFRAAFTTTHGRLQCNTQIMTLYREHVGNVPLSTYGL
jgi:peptidoglycan/xylan/chitin deacetylase (PgdA/CDA1 family)